MHSPLPVFFLPLLGAVACAQEPTADPVQQARRALLHTAGVKAPLTLLPVRLLGRPDANVADALGLVLERRGMSDLVVAETAFDAKTTAWEALPAALGAFVRAPVEPVTQPASAARHVLYAEFLGDPKQGPTEVRFVVVDAAGEVVLVDRQTPADAAFKRTAGRDPDPLGCATLVAERLFELADWRAVRGGVPNGKFATRWQQKSGAPDGKQRAAMEQRCKVLRGALAEASFAVFAPTWQNAADVDTGRLAKAVQTALLCQAATPIDGGPLAVPPGSNQQKRLFDLAAAAKAAVGKQAVAADYAIAMEMGCSDDGKHGFVNLVVLTKAGELVLADYQNDQHEAFSRLQRKTLADCEQLAIARLRQLLR